jgi:ribosomal protein S18 acetylase RimI-like enzyme
MQALAQELWRLAPERVETTAQALAWASAVDDQAWKRRLWLDDDRVLAWAWLFPPDELDWQAHPSRPGLVDEALDWFESIAAPGALRTWARAGDAAALEGLARRGYAHDPAAPFFLRTARDLDAIEEPTLPAGFRLRTTADGVDAAARVAVHRAAWEPSRFTAERYERVTRTWPFRPDLDVVVEAPDGRLAATVLAWYDDENRVGELEPVGTHPAFRRRGLARAATLDALRRLHEAGATHAIVSCRGDAAYPVPRLLYETVGFRELSRQVRLRRN